VGGNKDSSSSVNILTGLPPDEPPPPGWLKCDFHTHCLGDPQDDLKHTLRDLIDRAVELRFDVLAVTNHDQLVDIREASPYAGEKGLLLIAGIEKTLKRRHVLILNADKEAESIKDFKEIKRLKERGAVIVAPHPFYPSPKSLGRLLKEYIDLFDGIEYSFFHHRWFNFNTRAVLESKRSQLRLIGNSDCHNLNMLGHTYTFLRAEKSVEHVLQALKSGETQVVTRPVSSLGVVEVGYNWLRSILLRLARHIMGRGKAS